MVRSLAFCVNVPALVDVVPNTSKEGEISYCPGGVPKEGVGAWNVSQGYSFFGHPLGYFVGVGSVISDVVTADDGLVVVLPAVVGVEVSGDRGIWQGFAALDFFCYVERPSG